MRIIERSLRIISDCGGTHQRKKRKEIMKLAKSGKIIVAISCLSLGSLFTTNAQVPASGGTTGTGSNVGQSGTSAVQGGNTTGTQTNTNAQGTQTGPTSTKAGDQTAAKTNAGASGANATGDHNRNADRVGKSKNNTNLMSPTATISPIASPSAQPSVTPTATPTASPM